MKSFKVRKKDIRESPVAVPDSANIPEKSLGISVPKEIKPEDINVDTVVRSIKIMSAIDRNPYTAIRYVPKVLLKQSSVEKITCPLHVLHIMSDRYGEEWVRFDNQSFHYNTFEEENFDMIMAVKSLFNTDLYFYDPVVFENISLSLNGRELIVDVEQELLPDEMAFSIIMADILRNDIYVMEQVQEYIVSKCIDLGYSVFLYPLDIPSHVIPKDALGITMAVQNIENGVAGEYSAIEKDQHKKYKNFLFSVYKKIQLCKGRGVKDGNK